MIGAADRAVPEPGVIPPAEGRLAVNGCQRPTRRQLLQIGAGGVAGPLLLGACSGSPSPPGRPPQKGRIVFRTLGRTGLRIPVVSMGSAYSVELVPAALDAGIRYIHTSSSYAERNQERRLGEVFRGRPRDSFVVGTGPDLPYRAEPGTGNSMDIGTRVDPRLIAESIDGSLQRLGLDAVDIYYLASVGVRQTALHEPYLRAFEALKRQGKARFIGLTTHSNEPAVIRAAVESGVWDVVLTSYNFRQAHRNEVRAAIGEAAAAGLGVVAMKTQAGVYWDRTHVVRIDMKAALKWALQDENVHTAIPAFSNHDEVQEDLSVMEDLSLSAAERGSLKLGAALGLPGLYCQQCGRCRPQCPAGLDIPTLMRAHMYDAGHARPGKARDTLRRWTPADVSCRHCGRCDVRCALGFDVRARALDVARLLEDPEEGRRNRAV
jgi:hypothetical protein